MNIKYTASEVAAILSGASVQNDASIARGNAGGAQSIRVVRIDLSQERTESTPLKIGFPFLSLYVQGASDAQTFVQFKPDTKDEYQGKVTLRRKDSLNFGLSKADAFFIHPAQSGKFIEIVFFVDAQFTSGSQLIDDASITDNFNLNGTGEQSNRFPMVHLRGIIPLTSNSTADQFKLGNLFATNSKNILRQDMIGNNFYRFRVPEGFEFVVNHYKVRTLDAITGTTPVINMVMGSLIDSITVDSFSYGWDFAANLLETYLFGSVPPLTTVNSEVQAVNGFSNEISSSVNPQVYNGEGRLTFPAGSLLVAGIRLQAGAITGGTLNVDISGFLREVV